MKPKLIVVEEHHEAFYAWSWAIAEGLIPRSGNILLHVDEHADSAVPRLRKPLTNMEDLEAVRKFVYEELEISSFIWPAAYHRMFNRTAWLKRSHAWGSYWRRMTIRATDSTETQFAVDTIMDPLFRNDDPSVRMVEYALMTPADPFPISTPLILDIDLDYFCSNQFPNFGRRRIEITREAYRQIEQDPYHVLRIAPGMRCRRLEEDGRYYVVFHDYDTQEETASEQELEARIDDFVAYLSGNGIRAGVITLCRSLHSGYLPRALGAFIEKKLLDRLAGWSAFELCHVNELAGGAAVFS